MIGGQGWWAAVPYVEPPSVSWVLPVLGEHRITVFGPLVAVAVLVGWRRCLRYASAHGIDPDAARSLMERVLLVGFVVSHWFSLALYFPGRVVEDPWVLLWIPAGLSSVGGLLGGWLALAWWSRRMGLPRLRCADMLVFGMLAGLCVGRIGCALVHDHPGRVADPESWLAVGPWPATAGVFRYDLGLVELGLCAALLVVVHVGMDWRRAPPGRLCGVVAVGYAAVRFCLDFFRATEVVGGGSPDPRYLGLTAAQYVTVVLLGVGAWLLWRSRPGRSRRSWDDRSPGRDRVSTDASPPA